MSLRNVKILARLYYPTSSCCVIWIEHAGVQQESRVFICCLTCSARLPPHWAAPAARGPRDTARTWARTPRSRTRWGRCTARTRTRSARLSRGWRPAAAGPGWLARTGCWSPRPPGSQSWPGEQQRSQNLDSLKRIGLLYFACISRSNPDWFSPWYLEFATQLWETSERVGYSARPSTLSPRNLKLAELMLSFPMTASTSSTRSPSSSPSPSMTGSTTVFWNSFHSSKDCFLACAWSISLSGTSCFIGWRLLFWVAHQCLSTAPLPASWARGPWPQRGWRAGCPEWWGIFSAEDDIPPHGHWGRSLHT